MPGDMNVDVCRRGGARPGAGEAYSRRRSRERCDRVHDGAVDPEAAIFQLGLAQRRPTPSESESGSGRALAARGARELLQEPPRLIFFPNFHNLVSQHEVVDSSMDRSSLL